MKDSDDGERRALNLDCVADLFVQVAGQDVAHENFRLAILKAPPGGEGERIQLVGVGLPTEDQRIDLRCEVHQVEDHGTGLFDKWQRPEFGA